MDISEEDFRIINTACSRILRLYKANGDPLEYISYGWQGLEEARKKYDARLGASWTRFARRCVEVRILDQLRRNMPFPVRVWRMVDHYRRLRLKGSSHLDAIDLATQNKSKKNTFLFLLAVDNQEQVEADTLPDPTVHSSPLKQAIHAELYEKLNVLAETHPEAYAVVIGLYLEGRSQNEIAKGLDCSVSKVLELKLMGILELRRLYGVVRITELECIEGDGAWDSESCRWEESSQLWSAAQTD